MCVSYCTPIAPHYHHMYFSLLSYTYSQILPFSTPLYTFMLFKLSLSFRWKIRNLPPAYNETKSGRVIGHSSFVIRSLVIGHSLVHLFIGSSVHLLISWLYPFCLLAGLLFWFIGLLVSSSLVHCLIGLLVYCFIGPWFIGPLVRRSLGFGSSAIGSLVHVVSTIRRDWHASFSACLYVHFMKPA